MPVKISEVMTTEPIALPLEATVAVAAQIMRDRGIGDVLVTSDGRLCGLLTDRDIVVRAVAEGRNVEATTLSEICSAELATIRADDDVETAVRLMRAKAVRRLPVVEAGRPVGIVSLTDLAAGRPGPELVADLSADLSKAPPNT